MEKQRKTKLIIMISLMVAIVGMSLGFAAFSATLNISSSASVTPDSSAFELELHNTTTIPETTALEKLQGTAYNGAELGTPYFLPQNSLIVPIYGVFSEPGQYIEFSFYIHNVGEYDAYLRGITFYNEDGVDSNRKCILSSGSEATQALVDAACDDLSVSVDIGGTVLSEFNTTTSGHKLEKGSYELVVITLSYDEGGDRADGPFQILFGDIGIDFSTVASASLISFTIDGTTYQAEEGMTWSAWTSSPYNTVGFNYNVYGAEADSNEICSFDGKAVLDVLMDMIIADNGEYLTGDTDCSY